MKFTYYVPTIITKNNTRITKKYDNKNTAENALHEFVKNFNKYCEDTILRSFVKEITVIL